MLNLEVEHEERKEISEKNESIMSNEIQQNNNESSIGLEYLSPNHCPIFAASEVAALIGKNRFKSRSQALYTHLKKDSMFIKKIKEIKLKTNNDKEALTDTYLSKYSSDIKKMINDSVKIENSDQLQTHITACLNKVMDSVKQPENNLTVDVSKRIEKEVKSKICTGRGSCLERQSIQQFETDANLIISNCNEEYYEFDCGAYRLCGMVDGIDETGECVIEIKNRTRNSNYLGEYDIIQCMIYMKLTNLSKCKLVEFFPDRKFRVRDIDWNEQKFKEIDNELSSLADYIRKLTVIELENLIEENDFDSSK